MDPSPPIAAPARSRSTPSRSLPDDLVGFRFMVAFDGRKAPDVLLADIAARRVGGVILYRGRNIASAAQLRRLTASLHAAVPAGDPPILIGTDQEGGQFEAIGDGATAWPGNLALGAAGSTALARAAGAAIGRELAAVGVNVVFAPVCDLLSPAASTVLGTRTFGDDPALVGRLAAAMVRGIQSTGVAATVKHFPGHGAAIGPDPHVALPVTGTTLAGLERHLSAFRDPIRAGARLAMPSHLAVPGAQDGPMAPATVDPRITAVLRGALGFGGVTITDALDMGAMGPHEALPANARSAVLAGQDVLLTNHAPALVCAAREHVRAAARSGALPLGELRAAARRIRSLRRWLARRPRLPLEVVGSAAHVAVARQVAEAAVTLVRDRPGLLPLTAAGDGEVLVLEPRPRNLTPAETSRAAGCSLAAALASRGLRVAALELPLDPAPAEITALSGHARAARLAIIATLEAHAHPGQVALAERVAETVPTILVAGRTPYDVAACRRVGTAVTGYGSGRPNVEAVADALLGRIPFRGRLPVRLPDAG